MRWKLHILLVENKKSSVDRGWRTNYEVVKSAKTKKKHKIFWMKIMQEAMGVVHNSKINVSNSNAA